MKRLLVVCALVLGVLLSAGPAGAAEVLYRECFGNADSGATAYRDPAAYAWSAYHGGFALPVAAWTGSEDPQPIFHHSVTNELGRPQNLDNVNAGPSVSQTHGFYTFGQVWAYYTDRLLLVTDEFTFDRTDWDVTTISWWQGDDLEIDYAETRVAVRIADAWYVSIALFSNDDVPQGQFATSGNTVQHAFELTSAANAWRPLAFTPGSQLQLTLDDQLAADLPSGDITAFGLYLSLKGARYTAIDTFQINGAQAPEPASLALLSLGLVGLLRRRRKQSY